MSPRPEILTALADVPLSEDVPVTIVEGARIVDIDAMLSAAGYIRQGEYVAAANAPARFVTTFPRPSRTLEGDLYPETYFLPIPDGRLEVEMLIKRQLEAFTERVYLPNQEEIESGRRTLDELIKLASLLEREEPNPQLRPKVAGVLCNRLEAKMPLGVDATSRYELADWNDRENFLLALRDRSDLYNTRSHVGLPPTPIGAPSLVSFMAALRPEKSEYWYYLHDAKREIHFAKDLKEHEANRDKYDVHRTQFGSPSRAFWATHFMPERFAVTSEALGSCAKDKWHLR